MRKQGFPHLHLEVGPQQVQWEAVYRPGWKTPASSSGPVAGRVLPFSSAFASRGGKRPELRPGRCPAQTSGLQMPRPVTASRAFTTGWDGMPVCDLQTRRPLWLKLTRCNGPSQSQQVRASGPGRPARWRRRLPGRLAGAFSQPLALFWSKTAG